ncbi:MAG TPA: FAD-dependent oxidoreductase [Candidatus Eisenbacteria bacterium]|nr:FAD-dependent oxidoreductase [Candidatus Eisenbacteria bacterium]
MTSDPVPPASWWWVAPTHDFPPLDADLDADVLIVGGGVTGITLAYTLAEQGSVAAVLDAGPIAGAASGRNAGFLLAAPAEPYAERIALWGRDGARAVLQIGRRTHHRIRELAQTLGIACEYEQNGSLRLTRTSEETEDLRGSLPELRHDGFPMREIAVPEAVPAHAAPLFHAAFEVPEDGQLHPVQFVHGLAEHAVRRGARVHAHSRVAGARWQGGLWEARANGHVARARTLVLATNAYTPQLVPQLAPLIAPRRGQVLVTAPLPEVIAPRPAYAHWGYQYWRQTPDRRLLIGGWRDVDFDAETGYETTPTPPIQAAIEKGLRELAGREVAIEHRWAGTMGFARDGRPLVGWLDASHHLAVCAGFTGHGMGMAAACTQDMAELLAWKRAPGVASFDPQRFPELRQVREGIVALGAARD